MNNLHNAEFQHYFNRDAISFMNKLTSVEVITPVWI
jgi:hypothetical protein